MSTNVIYEKCRGRKLPTAICLIALCLFIAELSLGKQKSLRDKLPSSIEFEFNLLYEITPKQNAPDNNFNPPQDSNKPEMKLAVNLPQTITGRQEVTKLTFEPNPSRIFIENGNKYAEYILPIPEEKTKIKIHIKAKAFRYDMATTMGKSSQDSLPDANLNSFLQDERMIEKNDPVIQNIAQTIEGQTELDIVKNIYRYVIRNLNIDATPLKGVGAVKTARKKKGMCIDYCDLFVALCRAKNIPARVAAGYRGHFELTPKHAWSEVYFSKYGWVPLDIIAWNNISEERLDWQFYHLESPFLKFTNLRSDPILNNNYFYCYLYSDKNIEGMPSVVESIEFKKPLHKKHSSEEDYERARKGGHIK